MTRAKDMSDFGVSASAGAVLQTVFNTHSSESSFTNNTPTAITGLTQSITLKSANPYIYVILAINSFSKVTNNTALGIKLTANSNSALDVKLSDMIGYNATTTSASGSAVQNYYHNLTNDAAGATITYTPQFYSAGNNATVYINPNYTGGGQISQIILMEIAK
tara:strand:- start:47 stop:535 length:489 start_codon:yes stop_codon:yes gene_type:complete